MSPLVELPPSGKAGSLQASRPSGTVAIIGNHISLPQGVDSRDRLFEIIRWVIGPPWLMHEARVADVA
jgi:hypothetical protein